MTIQAGMPRQRAASDRAAAWFPEDGATTPREASSSLNEKTAFVAPRILKEPVFCRFSHLKKRLAPAISSSEEQVTTGVRWICGAMRWQAARIASRSGAIIFGCVVIMNRTMHYGTFFWGA